MFYKSFKKHNYVYLFSNFILKIIVQIVNSPHFNVRQQGILKEKICVYLTVWHTEGFDKKLSKNPKSPPIKSTNYYKLRSFIICFKKSDIVNVTLETKS